MNKVWFIADTHFGHKAIMNYENRPFESVEEMDGKIIGNWNSVVSPDDKVFVVGDFSLYGKEKTTEICNKLQGQKYLILGNHDTESEQYYRECGFENAVAYPIVLDNFWLLSHEPLYINSNMPYANIYGHVHNNPSYTMRYFKIAIAILKCPAMRGGGFAACAAVHTARASLWLAESP